MKAIAIIPARYASSRFPGKPLAHIDGMSMIERVYKQVKQCKDLDSVWVATDDDRIAEHIKSFGGSVCLTSPDIPNGTQRCYAAYMQGIEKGLEDTDIIINVQGDEPYIAPQAIDSVINVFKKLDHEKKDIVTLIKKIEDSESLFDPNVVKVVVSEKGKALYFSRQAIPFQRDTAEKTQWVKNSIYYKHIGLYAYKIGVLKTLVDLPQGKLEKVEKLEQLCWIEQGFNIHTSETPYESLSVDVPEDIEKLKKTRTI